MVEFEGQIRIDEGDRACDESHDVWEKVDCVQDNKNQESLVRRGSFVSHSPQFTHRSSLDWEFARCIVYLLTTLTSFEGPPKVRPGMLVCLRTSVRQLDNSQAASGRVFMCLEVPTVHVFLCSCCDASNKEGQKNVSTTRCLISLTPSTTCLTRGLTLCCGWATISKCPL